MPLFSCNFCTQQINADDTLAGAQVECPACASVIEVPVSVVFDPRQSVTAALPAFRGRSSSQMAASKPVNWVLWAPLLGTLVTFGIGLTVYFSLQPVDPVRTLLGNDGVLGMIAAAVGFTISVAIFAGVLALIVSGILAMFKKSFGRMLAYSFGITMAVMSVVGLLGQMFVAGFTSSHKAASSVAGSFPQAAPSPANYDAKVNEVAGSYGAALAALQAEYTTQVNLAGLDKLILPDRVAEDVNFRESYSMLAKIRRVVETYKKKILEEVGSLPARIEAAGLGAENTKRAVAEATEGVGKTMPLITENWEIEVQLVDDFAAVIEMLEASRLRWNAVSGKFTFEDDKDLERFNSIMARIGEKADRQAKLKQQMTTL